MLHMVTLPAAPLSCHSMHRTPASLSIIAPVYCWCHGALAAPCPVQVGQLELTHKGRAVYDSALPLDAAMQLFESCLHAEDGERC
jgi:hypothetical protein